MKYPPPLQCRMLGVGEAAPAFEGTTDSGTKLSLSDLRGRPLVLYFYPKAGSAGCSSEAREFAKSYSEFEQRGVALVGVSVDPVGAQQRFSSSCHLPFPLIADDSKEIARRYGVLGFLGVAKRVTFFVGADGRIEEVVAGLLPGPHVRRAVERLRGLPVRPAATGGTGPASTGVTP